MIKMVNHICKDSIPPRVLIVDDDPKIIDILGSFLKENFKCQIAINGEGALKILKNTDRLPDLILLDILMPGINGYRLCQIIKKDEKLREIPIIFISSLLDINSIEKAFEIGGIDYIEKPFNCNEVKARVMNHIKLHRKELELERNNLILNELVEKKVTEILDSQMATIFALAKLTESRDDATGKHLERVQVFCRLILEKLKMKNNHKYNIDDEYIEMVENASVLHDIGKIGIEDYILLKPGSLTKEEYRRMKEHTIIGSNTLREVYKEYPGNKFIELGIEIAHYHHEKWDGTGYPEALVGEEIPLSARVVALADLYDALRSKRRYKESFSHKKATEIICKSSGKHLDPLLVNLFLENQAEFEEKYNLL